MLEVARWLIALVAFVTALGGLLADFLLPAPAAQHIRNPRWSPHAKFHNAQGILMGFCLGGLALVLLFRHSAVSRGDVWLASFIASIYWITIFGARLFPGTAFVDPEFEQQGPKRPPAQLVIGIVFVCILAAACYLTFQQFDVSFFSTRW